ncbi:MAG: hypothetical protein NO482_07880 [Candidatus Methanomethylicia archaeon]|nr:hypothetical protein [Candidatus Methanomethylicia archaeon]
MDHQPVPRGADPPAAAVPAPDPAARQLLAEVLKGAFLYPAHGRSRRLLPPHTMSSKRPSCRFHYLTTKGRKVTKPEKKANKNLKRMPVLPL